MSAWQDMSTARKDGTPILTFSPTHGIHIASWLPERLVRMPTLGYGAHRQPAHTATAPGQWLCWSNRNNGDFAPTHWQPLPDPPS